MNKRSRPDSLEETLGAAELASTLNGDDPNAIYRCLRKFRRIVRYERKVAMGVQEIDVDSEAEAFEEEDFEFSKKIRKTESWKEDTADYKVPFVGTAFSRGDMGKVVVGEWPTGLLKEYLKKSPLAIEFTSDTLIPGTSHLHKSLLKSKKGRLSNAIFEEYLKAFSELISGAIPLALLRDQDKGTLTLDSETHQLDAFVNETLKKRVPGLLLLLKEETSNGKGKATVLGGCGHLVPFVLQILTRLVQTSVIAARRVAQTFEQNTFEGVMRFLLRPHNKKQVNSVPLRRAEARAACLELASAFARVHDSIVLSCVNAMGARDRKVAPGILYLSLREGISEGYPTQFYQESGSNSMFMKALRGLLLSLRLLVKKEGTKKHMLDLFSPESLFNLCSLVKYAPRLSNQITYDMVLAEKDNYDPSPTEPQLVSVEARRLLFTILADREKSSVLYSKSQGKRASQQIEKAVIRSHLSLLDGQPSIQSRLFAEYCLEVSPTLREGLLNGLSLPDMSRPFSCVSRIRLLSQLVCSISTLNNASVKPEFTIYPAALKKQIVVRILASSNYFVVSEMFKTLTIVLRHVLHLLHSLSNDRKPHLSQTSKIKERLLRDLPEFNQLLASLSRLSSSDSQAASIALTFGWKAISVYLELFQKEMQSKSFDLSKGISMDTDVFCTIPLHAQLAVLRDFHVVIQAYRMHRGPIIESFKKIMCITLSTRSLNLWEIGRKIAICLFLQFVTRESSDIVPSEDLSFEASCWVDGLTSATLNDFCQWMEDTSNKPLRSMLSLSKAWKISGLPGQLHNFGYSALLVDRISQKEASEFSADFIFCVAFKCVVFCRNPTSMAALISFSSGQDDRTSAERNDLKHKVLAYCRLLLRSNIESSKQVLSIALSTGLIRKLREPPSLATVDNRHQTLEYHASQRAITLEDALSVTRQMIHLSRAAGRQGTDFAFKSFERLLPVVLTTSGRGVPMDPYVEADVRSFPWIKLLFLTCPSLFRSESNAEIVDRLRLGIYQEDNNWGVGSLRASSLTTFVCAPSLSANATVDVLKLLHHADNFGFCCPRFVVSSLLNHGISRLDSDILSTDQVAYMMKQWLMMSPGESPPDLWVGFENFLHRAFATVPSSFNYIGICATSAFSGKSMLEKALETKMAACSANLTMYSCFLSALVKTDPTMYSPVLLEALERNMKTYESAIQDGYLDEALHESVQYARSNTAPLVAPLLQVVCNSLTGQQVPDARLQKISCIVDLAEHLELSELEKPLFRMADLLCRKPTIIHNWIISGFDGLLKIQMKCFESSDSRLETFGTSLFIGLGTVFPRVMKHEVALAPDKQCAICDIISWINNFMHSSVVIDKLDSLEERTNLIIPKWIRTCLRCGIGSHDGWVDQVRILLLKLARSILLLNVAEENYERLCGATRVSVATNVFSLMLSHSEFQSVLFDSESAAGRAKKLELVNLMSACMKVSPNLFDGKVYKLIRSAYSAGLSTEDRALRFLLGQYEAKNEESASNPVQWGVHAHVETQTDHNCWNWFVESLDQRRIWRTINGFPINDMITESSIPEGQANCEFEVHEHKYSPGFLLPLLLSFLHERRGLVNVHMQSQEHFSKAAQRVAEKGSLAFALASLCSSCEFIRRTSVGILALFLDALGSDEARDIISWRERPQLLMLLKSVQRGFALKIGGKNSGEFLVPRIPGVTAIFLARASWVFAHPIHPLYAPLNRYFLRINDDGGAFPDMNRIPSFVALFCSAADHGAQVENERNWALQLIRDGFLDELSLKPLLSCHSLEMLLTSIELVHSRTAETCTLMLQSLTNVLRFGGQRAAFQMIKNVGIISWIRSVLSGNAAAECFPNGATRLAMMHFSNEALCKAGQTFSLQDFYPASRGIGGLVLKLCVDPHIDERNPKFSAFAFVSIAIELLQSIQKPFVSHMKMPDFEVDGLDVNDVMKFLAMIGPEKDVGNFVESVCCFPLRPASIDDHRSCCHALLEPFQSLSSLHPGTIVVLEKIRAVVKRFPHGVEKEPLIKSLFGLREACFTQLDSRTAWMSCLGEIYNCESATVISKDVNHVVTKLLGRESLL